MRHRNQRGARRAGRGRKGREGRVDRRAAGRWAPRPAGPPADEVIDHPLLRAARELPDAVVDLNAYRARWRGRPITPYQLIDLANSARQRRRLAPIPYPRIAPLLD